MINCLDDFINLLNSNHISYKLSTYGYDIPCVILKKKNYLLYVYYESNLSYDLQKIPYTWGCSGSISEIQLFNLLNNYMSIDLKNNIQLSLF